MREEAAGGLVLRGGRVLLVRVRVSADPGLSIRGYGRGPLKKGDPVWSLPKGHLEPGETAREAALREVHEETGWDCAVEKTLSVVRYSFLRRGERIGKKVSWYLMRPLRRSGRPAAGEILGCRWASRKTARSWLRYPTDLRLLTLLKGRLR